MSREKQIEFYIDVEEMARDICNLNISCEECAAIQRKMEMSKDQYCKALKYAKRAHRKGYRKQSEGEWHFYSDYFSGKQVTGWTCGNCNKYSTGLHNYCPECGAKMKGGEE